MSVQKWKPGDVAMVTLDGEEWHIALRCGVPSNPGWEYVKGDGKRWSNSVFDARPLVVIDPEDREQVERLTGLLVYAGALKNDLNYWREVTHALREFADPKPRIEEPAGLGAVVETVHGELYVRDKTTTTVAHWKRARGEENHRRHRFADLQVVRVLSEGVVQ